MAYRSLFALRQFGSVPVALPDLLVVIVPAPENKELLFGNGKFVPEPTELALPLGSRRRVDLGHDLSRRVMLTGLPVRRTCSRTARQVTLNFEMAICCMIGWYFGHGPWLI